MHRKFYGMRETDFMKTWQGSVGCSAGLSFAAILLLNGFALSASGKAEPKKPAVAVAASEYVGSETCKSCHEESFKNFEATPHWKTTFGHYEGGQGCEACHGPGKAHVEGGGDTSKIFKFAGADPAEASKRCLSCHEY